MAHLVRTGISLEQELLARFDSIIAKKGYKNRSEAIRDLVRDYAVAEDVTEDRTVVGTLTMVYDHHRPQLSERLIEAQHHAHSHRTVGISGSAFHGVTWGFVGAKWNCFGRNQKSGEPYTESHGCVRESAHHRK